MSPEAQPSGLHRAGKATERRGRSRHRALLGAAVLTLGLAAQSCNASRNPAAPDTGHPRSATHISTAEATPGLLITQTNAVTDLTPGSPAQQLRGAITNPHPWPVYIRSISAKVTGTDRFDCPATNFTIAGSPATVNALLAPSPSTRPWSGITVSLTTTAMNQDACKNTTVLIEYRIP